MKPKSVSVYKTIFPSDQSVGIEIRGATKFCNKVVRLSPSEAMSLAQNILDDLQRIERAKKAGA